MSQQSLEQFHRRVTAAMIARARSREQQPPEGLGFSEDELKPLSGLPMIGCHVDPESQSLVVAMPESERQHAAEHEQQLRKALPGVDLDIIYTVHHDHGAPSKAEAARPLWGGVAMATEGAGGTLTLVVEKGGAHHTLLSAHVVGVGQTEQAVGQPRVTTTGTYGTVKLNPAGPARASDSALASIDQLEITGQLDRIWRAPDEYYLVIAKAPTDQLTVGTKVYMQGASSAGLQEGKITATNVTSERPSGLVLTGQILADYTAIPGDSGAPVFLRGDGDQVTFAGIEVGSHCGGELFSPWAGIAADLGL